MTTIQKIQKILIAFLQTLLVAFIAFIITTAFVLAGIIMTPAMIGSVVISTLMLYGYRAFKVSALLRSYRTRIARKITAWQRLPDNFA